MNQRWILTLIAPLALTALTVSAAVVDIPVQSVVMPVVPPTYSTQPVVSSQQTATFTDTGAPLYPLLGTVTQYAAPGTDLSSGTVTAPASPLPSLNQQIVASYYSTLQSQPVSLSNPVSYGAYGYSYGNYTAPVATNSMVATPSLVALTPVVNTGQSYLWMQVVNVSSGSTLSLGSFDVTTAPETGTIFMLAFGLLAFVVIARHKQDPAGITARTGREWLWIKPQLPQD